MTLSWFIVTYNDHHDFHDLTLLSLRIMSSISFCGHHSFRIHLDLQLNYFYDLSWLPWRWLMSFRSSRQNSKTQKKKMCWFSKFRHSKIRLQLFYLPIASSVALHIVQAREVRKLPSQSPLTITIKVAYKISLLVYHY